jgi:hypothetical protein
MMQRKIHITIASIMLILFVTHFSILADTVQPSFKSEPAPGKALINFYFYRARAGNPVMIWEKNTLVGIIRGDQFFQLECDPGEHLFIALSSIMSPLVAKLAKDKVYHVALKIRGKASNNVIEFLALNNNHWAWPQLGYWRSSLQYLTFDEKELAKREVPFKETVRDYRQTVESPSFDKRAIVNLKEEDGEEIIRK